MNYIITLQVFEKDFFEVSPDNDVYIHRRTPNHRGMQSIYKHHRTAIYYKKYRNIIYISAYIIIK